MRISFGSFTFFPWTLRSSTYHMFTHFGQHRKLVSSSIEVLSGGASTSDAEYQRQLSNLEATWYKRFVQQGEEKDKQLKESELLLEETERMKLEQNFNIRGALERIVFQARLQGRINSEKGTQKGLNELAHTKDFTDILKKVVQERCHVHQDVKSCFRDLYHLVSKHAHGNDGMIDIRGADYTENERAALVVFLMLKS
ncbi:hypothetical protein HOY80DRAFT_1070710 [Tuber brumale]|nr:hypothetical protein HOY80DRAFT_1070710 [Tuber brumale]